MGSVRHCPGSTFISLLWLDNCNPSFIVSPVLPPGPYAACNKTHQNATDRALQTASAPV